MENGQGVILNNADYLCNEINAKVLSGNISEVLLSVTIKLDMQMHLQSRMRS